MCQMVWRLRVCFDLIPDVFVVCVVYASDPVPSQLWWNTRRQNGPRISIALRPFRSIFRLFWRGRIDGQNCPASTRYQHLAAGATQDVVLTFKASDGTTASAEKTLTITITGTNDTPVASVATATSYLIPANGWSTTGDTNYTQEGIYGTATFNINTGVVSYVLDSRKPATQALAANSGVTDSFTVQVTDGNATAQTTASFAITGTDDAPTFTATSASGNNTAYANNGSLRTLFTGAAINAIDVGQTIQSLTFTVSGVDGTANEKISVDGTQFGLATTAQTNLKTGIDYTVSVAGGVATVTLSFSAGLSAAAAKALVESMAYRYSDATGFQSMSGTHVVTLTQITDSGTSNNSTALNLSHTLTDSTGMCSASPPHRW